MIRRWLVPKTRYHVYYWFDTEACGYLGQEEAGVAIQGLDTIVPVLWVLAYRR